MELEGSGVDASCGPTSLDGGRCVGLVPMECDETPLDLRLCTPFVLPLTFKETGGLSKVIETFFSTIINILG